MLLIWNLLSIQLFELSVSNRGANFKKLANQLDEPFPDRRLSTLAALAIVVFSFLEALTLVSQNEMYLAASHIPTFFIAALAARRPVLRLNQLGPVVALLTSFCAVLFCAFQGYNPTNGYILIPFTCFVLLNNTTAIVYGVTSALGVLLINLFIHGGISAGFVATRSMVFFFIAMLLAHAIISRLLMARREANFGRRIDAVTGVGNRSALIEDMSTAVDGHHRYSVHTTAICIRMNGLDELQAQLGAQAHSEVLGELVSIWLSRIRNTDRVFRYGNNTFVVMLPSTSEESASSLERDLIKACEVYDFSHGESVCLELKVCGVKGEQTWEQWLSELLLKRLGETSG